MDGAKTLVYHGDLCLGEVDVLPVRNQVFQFPDNEIRINRHSPPSDRCPPLAIIHTISPFSIRCRVQAKSAAEYSPLTRLYLSCFQEFKTAIVVLGDEEWHLVAMPSKIEKFPSFWCYSLRAGLYASCLGMLNLRCLAIVFDLDETLVVANTMKSFEDKIEVLSRRIDVEEDVVRVSVMTAELKRYIEDKELLKQYIENDSILENGRHLVAQMEEIPPFAPSQEVITRPIIRLQDKNTVLTRINPEVRDTSVLVRMRPAWEDLRSYLIAKGRRRFEVYVCTMAERDYALEIWRLLDPETNLISSNQLLDRLVCVKSGSRKSLVNVFQNGNCHPRMAMVIDDRLKVWDDKDQARVHVVPPFTPYFAPQVEIANAVPVLCVARNVACNVRGGFFKEFDENLLRKVFELCYENEFSELPDAPDVSYYLMSEDVGPVANGGKDVAAVEGICCLEGEASLNKSVLHGEQCSIQNSSDNGLLVNQDCTKHKDLQVEGGSSMMVPPQLYLAVLQEIARRCDFKLEFKSIVSSNKDLLFSVEVILSTENIGTGLGRTKEEAQVQAAENSLRNLASSYTSFITSQTLGVGRCLDNFSLQHENGFLEDIAFTSVEEPPEKEDSSISKFCGWSDSSKRLSSVLTSIKELCSDGQILAFHDHAPSSMALSKGEFYFQVEVAGQVLGKGVGSSKEEAELQAAEQALKTLKMSIDMQVPKLSSSSTC